MKLFYREKGNPSKPPLIILHGLWGASDNWLQVAGLLADKFHVFLPDLRNHGNSPHTTIHNYEAIAEDIREMIETLDLQQKPFLAGHSMGGKALMVLLLERPEIAAKAAIIDIAPQTYTASPDHCKLLTFILNTPLSPFKYRNDIHQQIRSSFSQEEDNQILFKNIRITPSGFEWKINAPAIQNNFSNLMDWPKMKAIYPAPILFIRGALSNYIQSSKSIEIHFPLAEIQTIQQSSHRIHVDQPILLAQTLSDFFLR